MAGAAWHFHGDARGGDANAASLPYNLEDRMRLRELHRVRSAELPGLDAAADDDFGQEHH